MSMSSDRISSPSETRSSCADARTSSHSRSRRDLCPKKGIAHQPYPPPGWDRSTADRPNRPRQPAGSSPTRGQTCRTRRERCVAAERLAGSAALRFHSDLPSGLLPLPRDRDRHEPAVNAGGVRSVSPTTSSATSAGAPARPAEQPRRDGGVTEHALLREDRLSSATAGTPAWLVSAAGGNTEPARASAVECRHCTRAPERPLEAKAMASVMRFRALQERRRPAPDDRAEIRAALAATIV